MGETMAQDKTRAKPGSAKGASEVTPGLLPQREPDGAAPTALDLPMADPLPDDIAAYFAKCEEKLGLVPNVLKAYAFDPVKLRAFMEMYNDLMLGPSGLTRLEREMIAVVVSAANRCFYCLAAHGQAVRQYSDDPKLGELLVMNYRAATLSPRHKAMLDFAWTLTVSPFDIEDKDRETLATHGFSPRDIWDVSAVVGFFNMSNRMATASDMRPNDAYHGMNR